MQQIKRHEQRNQIIRRHEMTIRTEQRCGLRKSYECLKSQLATKMEQEKSSFEPHGPINLMDQNLLNFDTSRSPNIVDSDRAQLSPLNMTSYVVSPRIYESNARHPDSISKKPINHRILMEQNYKPQKFGFCLSKPVESQSPSSKFKVISENH